MASKPGGPGVLLPSEMGGVSTSLRASVFCVTWPLMVQLFPLWTLGRAAMVLWVST